MRKLLVIVIVIVIAGVGVVVLDVSRKSALDIVKTAQADSKQKFIETSAGKSAYLIYPGPLNEEAIKAMNGFEMNTTVNTDGSVTVALTSTNPEYKNQQYTVKPGFSLYFIEKFPGDDFAAEQADGNIKDDTAIMVDERGFEV